MSNYIHQLPGRLRVRTPLMKNDIRLSKKGARNLLRIRGVHTVSVNDTTGSIVVRYNPSILSGGTLINVLVDAGCLDQTIIGFPRIKAHAPSYASPPRVRTARNTALANPASKQLLSSATKFLIAMLAERTLGKPGKLLASSFL